MQSFQNKTLYKRYVTVVVETDKLGKLTPLHLVWDEGKIYKIDAILEIRKAASIVGGCGILYIVKIQGQSRRLYYELNRWFIESTTP